MSRLPTPVVEEIEVTWQPNASNGKEGNDMREQLTKFLAKKQEQKPILYLIIASIIVSVPTSIIVTLIAKRLLKL